MSLYNTLDYRDIIRTVAKARQALQPALTYSALAKKAGIQRTYLSHVLNGRGNLSADQLYLIGTELKLTGDELDYLLLLLEIERCEVPARKKALVERRAELQARHLRAEEYLYQAPTKMSDEALGAYYSDTFGPIVHMAMHVEAFRRQPAALAARLGVPLDRVQRTLDLLARAGFVRLTEDGYELIETDIHLSPESPLVTLHAALFRMRAIERRQAAAGGKDFFFTATFAATDELRDALKAAFLEVVGRMSTRIRKVAADDVFHMNFDLFQV